MKKALLSLVLLSGISLFAIGQAEMTAPNYAVELIYPNISVSKEKLEAAESLSSLEAETNKLSLEFAPSWVRKYITLEISAIHNGKVVSHTSYDSDRFNRRQKDLMINADSGEKISIHLEYLPENNLTNNEPKQIDFSFLVSPLANATFPGGMKKLDAYLKKNAIDKIPECTYEGYDLSTVKFTINKEGRVEDAHLFGLEYAGLRKPEMESLLIQTINNMPCWTPAQYSDGSYAEQEFVLTVGSTGNCVVNLLNIKRDEEF